MDILMPQLGETVAEGKITVWFKSAGDAVKPGDNLFEIETDKVSMEVPATAAGVIAEIRVGAGAVAPVGAIVAVMAQDGGQRAADVGTPLSRPQAPDHGPISSGLRPPPADFRPPPRLDPFREVRSPERNYGPARLANGAVATPLARRLAGEAGIDLNRLAAADIPPGTIRRIAARDVAAILAGRDGRRAPAAGVASPAGVKALYEPGFYEEIPLDAMRRTIAARLTDATRIPQFHLTADIAVDRLAAIRAEANAAVLPDVSSGPRVRLTVTDFIVKALALALKRVPAANAVWAEDCILRFSRCDVGVAIAVENGLITPVIRGADAKPLRAVAAEIRDLAGRARTRRLDPAELVGGASAVTNLGMHGVREFAAILNPPHATILAVGAATRRPMEAPDGSVRFAGQMTVTLTCDHRVIDGALGAALLGAFRHFIEHPVGMMI